MRERLVPRTALIDRLLRNGEPVVSVVAPPGYGKTTLLAQWANQVEPRVAWVSCERVHNDPVALWSNILAALNRIEPLSEQATSILAASGGGAEAVPQLVVAISALQGPVLVVLDHLEPVTSPQCTTSIAELTLRVPDGWQLALASRDPLPIPLSRLRMDSRMVEIGVDDLAMAGQEAAALLRQAGANVSAPEADELVKRTEGWAAGLYLAALAIRSGSPATGFSFSGDTASSRTTFTPSCWPASRVADQLPRPHLDSRPDERTALRRRDRRQAVGQDARGARTTQPARGSAGPSR